MLGPRYAESGSRLAQPGERRGVSDRPSDRGPSSENRRSPASPFRGGLVGTFSRKRTAPLKSSVPPLMYASAEFVPCAPFSDVYPDVLPAERAVYGLYSQYGLETALSGASGKRPET